MAKPKVRIGRQTPTQSVILDYDKTKGKEAVKFYEASKRKLYDWQKLLIYDILAINKDKLYVHTKFGYSVPRRNGKNEVIAARELYGLYSGEQILHTAHRTNTSHTAWERLHTIMGEAGLVEKQDYKVQRQLGLETITMLSTGGRISFRTRTDSGGLGEGFDLLIIDEAQEYTTTQETSLKYVVSSSKNPQTIYLGTPPTVTSSGTVFSKLRQEVFKNKTKNTGWAEWSVENMTDVHNVDAWYETNPSLGLRLTERIIGDEISDNDLDFNIQRLGYWTKTNLKSEISVNQWKEVALDVLPGFKGRLFVGIKYGADGMNTSMCIAVKTKNDKYFVESIDCQPQVKGNDWIFRFLKEADYEKVIIDCSTGQQELLDEEFRALKCSNKVIYPKVAEVIAAGINFQTLLQQKDICHMSQPSLQQSVTNCQKRSIGTAGGFGYKSIKEGVDISLMESMIYALWGCKTFKERRKQKVYC